MIVLSSRWSMDIIGPYYLRSTLFSSIGITTITSHLYSCIRSHPRRDYASWLLSSSDPRDGISLFGFIDQELFGMNFMNV
jgi:hypothetical protein